MSRNGVVETSEITAIGKNRWSRVNGGAWRKNNDVGHGGLGGLSKVTFSSYKTLGSTILAGQKVTGYKSVTGYLRVSDDGEETKTEIYWVTSEGKFVKTVRELQDNRTKTLSRTSTLYEYDAVIKIVPPTK